MARKRTKTSKTTTTAKKTACQRAGAAAKATRKRRASRDTNLHKDLKADFVMANPPFNDSDWGGNRLRDDVRWKWGVPPANNANFAWVSHFIHHLSPSGMAGFVLANGSMSSPHSGEGEIRGDIVEADLVDCMIAMPGQLFYSTQIPVCLWLMGPSCHKSMCERCSRHTSDRVLR